MRTLVVLLILLVPVVAEAIPEEGFAERFTRDVEPYYFNGRRTGFIEGKRGIPLSFVAFERENERGAFVYLPGRGGSHEQAMELFYDMRDWGYSVYALDHRGQGASGRMLDNHFKGHVEDFQYYVDDVKTFMDEVVNRRHHDRVFLSGISMGGAVATAYAEQNAEQLDGLILMVPMHQPNYAPFDENSAAALGIVGVSTGHAEDYAVTQGDPSTEEDTFTNSAEDGTHSRVRWDQEIAYLRRFPETLLGGVTYGWGHETVKATRKMRKEAKQLTMPVLLFQGGEDVVVINSAQDAVCAAAPDCTKHHFKTARHGILVESDDIRDPMMEEIHAFLDAHSGRGTGCDSASPSGASGVLMLAVWFVAARFRRHGPRPRLQ